MIRRCAAVGVVLLGVLAAIAPREAAPQDARAFIATLGREAIQVMGPSVPAGQRLVRFRELFRNDFDLPTISQFVLGPYWRNAAPEQRQEFLGLFQEHIVRAYTTLLGQYGGEPFNVTGARLFGEETVVTSEVIRQNGSRIQIDWYLVNRGGSPKITDVHIGGVSMRATKRDDFIAFIQSHGGRLEALNQKLASMQ